MRNYYSAIDVEINDEKKGTTITEILNDCVNIIYMSTGYLQIKNFTGRIFSTLVEFICTPHQ